MRFSEAWLREWVNPEVSTEELVDQLSMAGLEVDSVEPATPEFSGVVVGDVITKTQHPEADKLSVCIVDVGAEENLQIVCGAANVAAGMRVPVATVGAKLQGGFRIKKAKLRGIESRGMICSAAELGLAESSAGILPLPADASIGHDFRDYLQLDDQCIEVDLTPDRGDCLGLSGIAREVGVINRCPVIPPAIEPVAALVGDAFSVSINAGTACPRYTCRIVKGIDPQAATPLWMQERLRRGGIRSISPVVDVTNYVLLELGQPMHGFDLARLSGGINVRMAAAGEKLTLLDGQEITMDSETLLIADDEKPLALAGIMGGESSGVDATTKDILLESAFFTPTAILGKARSYGLHTDSSHRFERGVDPQLQVVALERATRLLLDIVGGHPGPVVEAKVDGALKKHPSILLRRERIGRVLGVTIADLEIMDILQRLGMKLTAVDAGWQVRAPSRRFDIAIEVDLIEEIGRIYGYARIPVSHSASAVPLRAAKETAFDLERARQLLVDRGYQEAVTYSFVSPESLALFDPDHQGITLSNPISADMAIMRTTLWAGLASAAVFNQARQQQRIRLFESGLRFVKKGDAIEQEPMLAGLIMGELDPEQWSAGTRAVDFYDIKADVEEVLALTGNLDLFRFVADSHPVLHPGQAATILRGDEPVGWVGMLHPERAVRADLDGNAFLFEIRLKMLEEGRLPEFSAPSKFPSIRRDLALVVDEDVSYGQIREVISQAAPQLLKDIRLFDVYTGEKVDSGRKSIALGLILQESSHTLTDEEVENVTATVLDRLRKDLGASLRE